MRKVRSSRTDREMRPISRRFRGQLGTTWERGPELGPHRRGTQIVGTEKETVAILLTAGSGFTDRAGERVRSWDATVSRHCTRCYTRRAKGMVRLSEAGPIGPLKKCGTGFQPVVPPAGCRCHTCIGYFFSGLLCRACCAQEERRDHGR